MKVYFVEILEDYLRHSSTKQSVQDLIKLYLRRETHKELSQQLFRFCNATELQQFVHGILQRPPTGHEVTLVEYH